MKEEGFLTDVRLSILAKKTGISESSLKRYRREPAQIRLGDFLKCAKVLGWSQEKIDEICEELMYEARRM